MDVDRSSKMALSAQYRRLQWSHVLMDVDRNFGDGLRPFPRFASMEPRPDGRG